MKLTYRKARTALLIMMLLGLVALVLAGHVAEIGSPLRTALIGAGVGLYVISLAVMMVGFKCPACGARFFKSALFLAECPICGYRFSDFELGKRVDVPEDEMWEHSGESAGQNDMMKVRKDHERVSDVH